MQRRVPAFLRTRDHQPANSRRAQQGYKDGLQDSDAGPSRNDASDDGEQGPAKLGEDEEERQRCGTVVGVE